MLWTRAHSHHLQHPFIAVHDECLDLWALHPSPLCTFLLVCYELQSQALSYSSYPFSWRRSLHRYSNVKLVPFLSPSLKTKDFHYENTPALSSPVMHILVLLSSTGALHAVVTAYLFKCPLLKCVRCVFT